ncbi:hypothetical protein [Actinomadura macrotermitis]|uniref:Uncharacterized protein n=1 Tax=Actinomadura macrotermitis TaxID=2585200 RepID=A0A7K0BZ31_9ACTN|nr:hypothetical protein [Actinomadura macrotermitis]MQY06439.1 hypothetical protein [Actinomadura macrotermitis]
MKYLLGARVDETPGYKRCVPVRHAIRATADSAEGHRSYETLCDGSQAIPVGGWARGEDEKLCPKCRATVAADAERPMSHTGTAR